MGKRKRDKSSDLMRKLRKLEREVQRSRRRRRSLSDSSDTSYDCEVDVTENLAQEDDCIDPDLEYGQGDYTSLDDENVQPQMKSVVVTETSLPLAESAVDQPVTAPTDEVPATSSEENVPAEILSILGEAKQVDEQFGKKISQEISERWGKILLEGLAKDAKEELLNKMLIPENFQLAKAPKLNPEVATVLTEPVKNRDKRQELSQNQLGSAIAGVVNLTTEVISSHLDKMQLIQKLSDISQVLLDLHYQETQNRRRLIIPLLDKGFANIAQNVRRNIHLFGDNLDENIKTKKSLEKSSQLIKKPTVQYTNSRRTGNQVQPGNSRAPPRQQTSGARSHAAPHAPTRYYREAPPPPTHAARRQTTLSSRHRGRAVQTSRNYDRKSRR